MEIFDKYQQNLGDMEWNGNAVQAPSPCLLLSKWAANSQGTEENHPLGSHCRDGHRRNLKGEARWEQMPRLVPTRFPQLWRGLLVNISYQFSIQVQQVPGIYKQNSFNNFISGIHCGRVSVYSPGSSDNAYLCDKWVGCSACWEMAS